MPKLVYMNVSTLKTLSDRQFYSGFAEIMKHGLIKDAVFMNGSLTTCMKYVTENLKPCLKWWKRAA